MQTINKPTTKKQITFKGDNSSYLPHHPSTILKFSLLKRNFPAEVAASIGAVWYCNRQSSKGNERKMDHWGEAQTA